MLNATYACARLVPVCEQETLGIIRKKYVDCAEKLFSAEAAEIYAQVLDHEIRCVRGVALCVCMREVAGAAVGRRGKQGGGSNDVLELCMHTPASLAPRTYCLNACMCDLVSAAPGS
jgi:hypothetical protein